MTTQEPQTLSGEKWRAAIMRDSFHFKYPGPNVPACHCQSRTLCIPFSLSLVSFLLFSFSLSGLSGTAAECLSELMAFLSRENWSSRIITVIPLFKIRICLQTTEHDSGRPPTVNTYLPRKSPASRSRPAHFHSHLQVKIHLQWKRKCNPDFFFPHHASALFMSSLIFSALGCWFQSRHNWHFAENQKKRKQGENRYLHLPGDKGQTELACQGLQSKDSNGPLIRVF